MGACSGLGIAWDPTGPHSDPAKGRLSPELTEAQRALAPLQSPHWALNHQRAESHSAYSCHSSQQI